MGIKIVTKKIYEFLMEDKNTSTKCFLTCLCRKLIYFMEHLLLSCLGGGVGLKINIYPVFILFRVYDHGMLSTVLRFLLKLFVCRLTMNTSYVRGLKLRDSQNLSCICELYIIHGTY